MTRILVVEQAARRAQQPHRKPKAPGRGQRRPVAQDGKSWRERPLEAG